MNRNNNSSELENRLVVAESAIMNLVSDVKHLSKQLAECRSSRYITQSTPPPSTPIYTTQQPHYSTQQPHYSMQQPRYPVQQPRYKKNYPVKDNSTTSLYQNTLADILVENEEVMIQVDIGKDSDNNQLYATAFTVFNNPYLTIVRCELVPELVNMKSTKPGELLYKFINELKTQGHIKNAFIVAPWKQCYVLRNDTCMSFFQLSKNKTNLTN